MRQCSYCKGAGYTEHREPIVGSAYGRSHFHTCGACAGTGQTHGVSIWKSSSPSSAVPSSSSSSQPSGELE